MEPELALKTETCKDTNNGVLDKHSDSCAWYANNKAFCGNFDTYAFRAGEMCCACGGGTTETTIEVCHETNNGYVDTGKSDCEWYYGNEQMCGDFDTRNFNATKMCCACEGGRKAVVTTLKSSQVSEASNELAFF